MTKHRTGTRDEWLAARLELLAGGEGAHPAQRRAGAAAAGAAVGPDRQGVPIRHRRGERLAGGSLPGALAAARLPLHVRARLQGGVSVLLGDRRRVRRLRRPPGQPRRHAVGGVAGAAGEAAGVQAADGLDASPGRRRSAATSTSTSTSGSPRSSSATGVVEYNFRREDEWAAAEAARGRSPRSRPGRHRLADVHRASGRA